MKELDRRTREYVLELVTTLKQTRSRIASAKADYERWAERVRLARQKGRDDLEREAAARMREEEARLDRLKQEERELAAEAGQARSEWSRAGIRTQLNVDAERLLASLEKMAGAPDSTAQELDELELDNELSRLKSELESAPPATSHTNNQPEEENSQ